uniref:Uncharacterized protein n=1 Tax=Bosea sp. NBC_00436 TaxID=2969620 RepID=A0A9E7ZXV6_9HYPH
MILIPTAWEHLQPASIKALLEPAGEMPHAIRLTPPNVPIQVALDVPMVIAARLLLERAAQGGGLVLTPAGFLKRADVRHVFDQTEWPGYDRATTLAMNKVINEQDAYGVLFTRVALQAAGLLRKRAGVLKATKLGQMFLAPEAAPELLSALFQAVFWKLRLHDFDRNPLPFWPQHHVGLVLWCLSVTAHRWSNAEYLTPLCTIMDAIDQPLARDLPGFAMVTRVLRPLTWLSLMESREQKRASGWVEDEDFRKTPLFDQLLDFKVEMIGEKDMRH